MRLGFSLLLYPTRSNQTQRVLLWPPLAVQEGIPLSLSPAHIHGPGTVPVCLLFSLKVPILLKTALNHVISFSYPLLSVLVISQCVVQH